MKVIHIFGQNEPMATVSIEPLEDSEISDFLDDLDGAVARGELTSEERTVMIYRQSDLWWGQE